MSVKESDSLLPKSSGINRSASLSKIKLTLEKTVEEDVSVRKRSRSSTVSVDMTPSDLNPIVQGRRELFGSLPFFSAFGQYTCLWFAITSL